MDGPWRQLYATPTGPAAPAAAQGPTEEDIQRCFPIRRHPDHPAQPFDATVLLYPSKFADWAKTHKDASALLEFVSSPNAAADFYNSVGYLREYGNTQAHRETCEYWMPIGCIDNIIRSHSGSQFVADRRFLVDQLLRMMRVQQGRLLDEYAFQVLQVEIEGQACFFWRANQPYGKFQYWATSEPHARRQEKRQDWHQRNAGTSYPYQDVRMKAQGQGPSGATLPPPPPAPKMGDAWAGWTPQTPPGHWGGGGPGHSRRGAWGSPQW